MGQYFIIVNLDKKEYFEPRLLKLWEICANNDCRVLPYLLATNNPSGTSVRRIYDLPPEEAKRVCEEETGVECEVVHHSKDFDYTVVEPKYKYFGRWCGDRIAVVGDYADQATNYDGPSFTHILETYRNITDEVVREFNTFIGVEDLKIRGNPDAISPDTAVSAEGYARNPKISK